MYTILSALLAFYAFHYTKKYGLKKSWSEMRSVLISIILGTIVYQTLTLLDPDFQIVIKFYNKSLRAEELFFACLVVMLLSKLEIKPLKTCKDEQK